MINCLQEKLVASVASNRRARRGCVTVNAGGSLATQVEAAGLRLYEPRLRWKERFGSMATQYSRGEQQVNQ